jgi:hypothetical protein
MSALGGFLPFEENAVYDGLAPTHVIQPQLVVSRKPTFRREATWTFGVRYR